METIRHVLSEKTNFIWSVQPDSSVYDALRLMAEKEIGALLVMKNERLVGIMSERDYARKVILLGRSSKETKVSQIMSSPVITIHPDQTIIEAIEIMTCKHVRHLPVSEDGQHVVGVISIGDLLQTIIYTQRETIRILEDGINQQKATIADLEESLGVKYEHIRKAERLCP